MYVSEGGVVKWILIIPVGTILGTTREPKKPTPINGKGTMAWQFLLAFLVPKPLLSKQQPTNNNNLNHHTSSLVLNEKNAKTAKEHRTSQI